MAQTIARLEKVPTTKYGQVPASISVNSSSAHWQQELGHELGHILTAKYVWSFQDPVQLFRSEVMAWRLAKGFTKSFLFSDDHALKCLCTYIPGYWGISKKVKFLQRFKIRELNQGVKL
jgi:hypothetical protein